MMKLYPSFKPFRVVFTSCLALCSTVLAAEATPGPTPGPVAVVVAAGSAASPANPAAAAISPPAAALVTYASLVSGIVADAGDSLAGVLKDTGKPSLSLAAVGFRELVTGERSLLAEHLDQDLCVRSRDDTPYGVPSAVELRDAYISVGGNGADFSQPGVLKKLGRLLSVDVVFTGYYVVQPSSVSMTVRLLRCGDGAELWTENRTLPISALLRGDLVLETGSAPTAYGQEPELSAPLIAGSPVSPTASPSGLSPTPTVASRAAHRASADSVRREANIHETEFSLYRLDVEAGYKYFEPQNATFKLNTKSMSGAYVNFNWSDILHVEFDYWYQASLPQLEYPVSNLFGYGMSAYATAPLRLGHYWVLYAGLGGRFETINVAAGLIPSQDSISFGNNSFFAIGGVKAHRGPVGVDASVAYDMMATYDPYLTAKLGLYYEYEFE